MSDEAKARELFDDLHPHFQYGRHAEAQQAIAAALAAEREAGRKDGHAEGIEAAAKHVEAAQPTTAFYLARAIRALPYPASTARAEPTPAASARRLRKALSYSNGGHALEYATKASDRGIVLFFDTPQHRDEALAAISDFQRESDHRAALEAGR